MCNAAEKFIYNLSDTIHSLSIAALSLSTGSSLIYDHDFHLQLPQYQQVVDGIESPSSHFRIGFSAWQTDAVAALANVPAEYMWLSAERLAHQHLVHGCDMCVCVCVCVCVFMANFCKHMHFWELVCQPQRGVGLSMFVCTCITNSSVFIKWEYLVYAVWSPFLWRQHGLIPPAALFSRRLSCEVALLRWLMVLALLLPIGEQWQTVHTAQYFNLAFFSYSIQLRHFCLTAAPPHRLSNQRE